MTSYRADLIRRDTYCVQPHPFAMFCSFRILSLLYLLMIVFAHRCYPPHSHALFVVVGDLI
ncbi:unnamed protein product, partial [Musa acuminata var. zebrina]